MGYSAQSTNFFQESEISGSGGVHRPRWLAKAKAGNKKPMQGTGSFYSVSNQLF